MSSDLDHITICITRQEAGLNVPLASWADVASVTRRLPLSDAGFFTSMVGQIFASPEGQQPAQDWLVSLIEPESLRSVVARRLSRRPRAALASPTQLVAAWRELALHGSPAAEGSLEDASVRALLWEWLLMITEALERDGERLLPGMTDITSDAALVFVATSAYLTSRDSPALVMARYFDILDRVIHRPDVKASGSWVDLEEAIEVAIGYDWRLFMAIGCALAMPSINYRIGRQPHPWLVINPETFFPRKVERPVVDRILAQVSCNLPMLRARHEELGIAAAIPPNPLPLLERPLIRLPRGDYCPSLPQLLVERFTSGLYHVLWNAWRKKTGQFKAFWGEVLESYVDSLFESVYPSSSTLANRLWLDQDITYGDRRPADVMVDCGETLVLFEFTHSGVTLQAAVAGDATKFREDLEKIVIDKARQLDAVIHDCRAGKFALGGTREGSFHWFLPVIVVERTLPLFAPIVKVLRSRLDSERLLQEPGVRPLQILTMEECEGLLAAACKGESILDALMAKVQDGGVVGESFKNYRHRIGKDLRPVDHPVLISARDRLLADWHRILFDG